MDSIVDEKGILFEESFEDPFITAQEELFVVIFLQRKTKPKLLFIHFWYAFERQIISWWDSDMLERLIMKARRCNLATVI